MTLVTDYDVSVARTGFDTVLIDMVAKGTLARSKYKNYIIRSKFGDLFVRAKDKNLLKLIQTNDVPLPVGQTFDEASREDMLDVLFYITCVAFYSQDAHWVIFMDANAKPWER